MVDAVLLEWEGVLADTASARCDALLRALAEESVHVDASFVEAHCQRPTVHAAAEASLADADIVDPTLVDLVTLRATRAFGERLAKGFVLLPGAREFVQRAQLSAPVAIVTAASRAETDFMLRLADLDGAVTTVVTGEEPLDPPPSPAPYERALEQLGRRRPLQRDRVVALAAKPHALIAARAAGVRTVAVGAPAHVALNADGAVGSVRGLTIAELSRLAGVALTEPRR
jgi:beta-phosphoglucomutase-like phosphatase (HAD superfamily)